jgi:hypothetical protein
MRIGVVFPQTEIGAGAVRAYAERVEELGFSHVLAYDHVVGADPEAHAPWTGPYDMHTTFHEPMVIFGNAARAAGRDPSTIGIEGRVSWGAAGTAKVVKQAARWRDAGATHLSVNTMGAGLGAVDAHLGVLAEVAGALDLVT